MKLGDMLLEQGVTIRGNKTQFSSRSTMMSIIKAKCHRAPAKKDRPFTKEQIAEKLNNSLNFKEEMKKAGVIHRVKKSAV